MLIIGLTGSIAMGKSSAADYLAERGAFIFSADEAVHQLYEGEAVGPVGAAFPGVVREGVVDRELLSALLQKTPQGFAKLEEIVHPMVLRLRDDFISRHRRAGAAMVVLDIPLLFEKQLADQVDVTLLVSAGADEQRRRVLQRPGMSADKLDMILQRQLPDAQKRQLADFVIDTSGPFEQTHAQLDRFLKALGA